MELIKYKLVITPAISPAKRHRIEKTLESIGYRFIGGGTNTDNSQCDISFEEIKDDNN